MTDNPQNELSSAEMQGFIDWWLANPDIAPLKVSQEVLDLLLYGNAYLDANAGFPIKARDIAFRVFRDTAK